MNTNNLPQQNDAQNADLYEDAAIKRNRILRNVAVGAGLVAGGAVADAAIRGTMGAATETPEDNIDLNEEDILNGAEVAEENHVEETTEYVRVEKPVQQAPQDTHTPEPAQAAEPAIEWEDTESLYIDGEKVMSVQTGKVEGHDFTLLDENGDDIADYLAIDMNDDGKYSENEITHLTPYDNIHMQASTPHEREHHLHSNDAMFADNGHGGEEIHNNFEDEKTGENYYGDYAENNQDYNPHADGGNNYASLNSMEEENTIEETTTDSYDMAYEDDIHNDASDLAAEDFTI